MKNCIILCLFFLVNINLVGQKYAHPLQKDKLIPAQSVKISGSVGEKLDASYCNRILAQDVNRLIEPFRNRTEASCWQSEFWGKWFTSAVLAYRYRPEPQLKAVLDKAVTGLLATQTSDGYIGNYTDSRHLEAWDIWGRKYCMLGLLAYYDLTKDIKAMTGAEKEADFLIKELSDKKALIVRKGSHRGMAASSVLEPICLLYARTSNQKYLDFAKDIIRQWETPDGPQLISKSVINVADRFPKPKNWWDWEQGQKAYEMMSCYEGLLELYRLTGNPEYRKAVENTWQNIVNTEINIVGSGASAECWFHGKELQTIHNDHYQETCVTATWIKLSQQLLRLTGEVKYADAIEQSWYNALLGAMHADGADWAKYSPLSGQRLQGSEQCGMGLNCCVASGPRGLFTLPLTCVMGENNGIRVNFFVKGDYHLTTPEGKEIELIQETDYPVSDQIHLKLMLSKESQFTLSIRIPSWSQRNVLKVNGQTVEVKPGTYAQLNRIWKSGDTISFYPDMRGRMITVGKYPENIAIQRGPIVLARDARLGKPHIDAVVKPLINKEGYVDLKSASAKTNGIWMSFTGLFKAESNQEQDTAPVEITLCDYASAGNTIDENSWFRVWLPQSFDPTR